MIQSGSLDATRSGLQRMTEGFRENRPLVSCLHNAATNSVVSGHHEEKYVRKRDFPPLGRGRIEQEEDPAA